MNIDNSKMNKYNCVVVQIWIDGGEKMKRVTVELDDELAKQLKILAINSNGTVKSYVTNLIEKDLQTKKDIRK